MKKGKGRWRKEEKEREEREREKRAIFVLVLLELPRTPSRTNSCSSIFFQGKPSNFKPLNPFIICWDNFRIDFLIYFIEKG